MKQTNYPQNKQTNKQKPETKQNLTKKPTTKPAQVRRLRPRTVRRISRNTWNCAIAIMIVLSELAFGYAKTNHLNTEYSLSFSELQCLPLKKMEQA